MINYSCDLCGEKCGDKVYKIPIAATFSMGEPCDLLPIEVNLCKKCKSSIYKTMERLTSPGRMKELNRYALDIKMDGYGF